MSDILEPSEVRAEIARAGVPAYVVAAAVRLHPSRLSTLLRSNTPFPQDLGRRILSVLKKKESLLVKS